MEPVRDPIRASIPPEFQCILIRIKLFTRRLSSELGLERPAFAPFLLLSVCLCIDPIRYPVTLY